MPKPRTSETGSRPLSVCFIGNSHIAALKLAWTNRAPKVASGFSATFFSAQNRLMGHIEVKGRALVPGRGDLADKLAYTSGGVKSIEVDKYDAFVLVGSGFGVDMLKLVEIGGTPAHLRWKKDIEPLMSQACYDEIFAQILRDSQLVTVLRMIRSIAPAPALIAAAPYLSECVLEEEPLDTDRRFHEPEFLTPIVARCKQVAGKVAAELGCEVVWQDDATVAERAGYTKLDYGIGAARFSMHGGKSPVSDRRHGNEEYGALLLGHVLKKLDAMTDGRVLPKTRNRAKPTPPRASKASATRGRRSAASNT